MAHTFNGHFDGTKWSEAQWVSEFTQFHKFVETVFSIYPGLKESFSGQWQHTLGAEIKGFRAPLLAESAGTDGALESFHYTYDSSKVLNYQWPYQEKNGIWNIALSEVGLYGTNRRSIAMDYNMLYGQCEGKFNPKNGGEVRDTFARNSREVSRSDLSIVYSAVFKSYYGNRAPISIGHHFSLFNRGIYWMALQKFVYSVCTQPDVKCVHS